MITFRHCLSEAELAATMPHLREAFALADLDFDTMDVRFEYAEKGLTKEPLEHLNLQNLRVIKFDDFPQETAALPLLKMSAWERANPTAPWWRRAKPYHRR